MQNAVFKLNEHIERKNELHQLTNYLISEFKEKQLLVQMENYKSTVEIKLPENIGDFRDNMWIFIDYKTWGYVYFDFSKIKDVKYSLNLNNSARDNIILLLKCWIGEKIVKACNKNKIDLEKYSNAAGVFKYFSPLVNFINDTDFINEKYLDESKGSKIKYFINQLPASHANKIVKTVLIDFLTYSLDFVDEHQYTVTQLYINKLHLYNIPNAIERKSRVLPDSKSVFQFSNYVESFFNDECIDAAIKNYYMPICIWWKITSIIPMRPSEFCIGLERNSLYKEADSYFINIKRIKRRSADGIPFLKRISITKELYDIISDYIYKTDSFGKTKTLISYPALLEFHRILNERYGNRYGTIHQNKKVDHEHFTLRVFSNLMHSFYKNIIFDMYHDTVITTELLPGDTRHIAFTSLLLQGYSPIEAAVIGGHSTLDSIDSYTCSTSTYIDMETQKMSRQDTTNPSKEKRSLYDIIFSMPQKCPKDVHKCLPAYVGNKYLGYCTLNITTEIYSCKRCECYLCDKWWCEPNIENFLLLTNIVKYEIERRETKLERNTDFILSLIKMVEKNKVNENIIISESERIKVQSITKQIEEETKNIINIKSKLSEV